MDEIIDEKRMLFLRTNKGILAKDIRNIKKLDMMIKEKFLEKKGNKIVFTTLGWTVFDSIFIELFI